MPPLRIGQYGISLSQPAVLATAATMLSALVMAEWYSRLGVSLGLLYILPVVLAATVLSRRQIVLAACACAAARGLFVMHETPLEQALRFSMAAVAYAGCGLLVAEISRRRRAMLEHYARLRAEQRLRRRAERRLRLLADSSPAAILTVDSDGRIIAANRATQDMMELDEEQSAVGRPVGDFLPVLADALSMSASVGDLRTSTSTWGRRADGSAFPATTWFSVYGDGDGRKLAAIVADASDEVREREVAHFSDLQNHNRLLAGAVSHEIRNLCSAAGVVASNLARHPAMHGDPDLAALQSLVRALLELASFDLRQQAEPGSGGHLRLQALCTELQLIIGPDWADLDGAIEVHVPADFPAVRGNRQALLQVLLNLSQNALRAVSTRPARQLRLAARIDGDRAVLAVQDSGPGIRDAATLFQPFRPGADGTGLGLYISRTLMAHQGGQLRHVAGAASGGACFELLLPLASSAEAAHG
ncbi:MAG: ATP-binding protein [Ferrovibrio sp.]|uniref:ATP-binding protein n=1 Tax=Ferrovibrio sp. TaxID=1917215 RepID=UPI002602E746|nr:ATP-binding protein [Ferrovibrio sp.]MCW0235764.1 ATP-binding protein [Ferrovibrio sp.]